MSVVHSPDSNYAKEMRKWEAHHTQYGPPGRPYTYAEYPTRLYKAERKDGRIQIVDGATAHHETGRRNLEARGFVAGGQAEAIKACERQELEFATLAAERHYDVRRLSEAAQAEVKAVEAAAGAQHLPTIPETPIKKRGRPAKVPAPAVE